MQRQISGYHLLMLLTNVDGLPDCNEDMVVKDWLTRQFPLQKNLDAEMETIASLRPSDYATHFHQHMELYYNNSTEAERLELLQFAVNLIKADGTISKNENRFFDMLYEAWGRDEREGV